MTGEELPKARVRRRRLFTLAWFIPLIAAAVAAWLVWGRMSERGPEITITFGDGGGLRPGITPVKYRGVIIGEVSGVGVSEDLKRSLGLRLECDVVPPGSLSNNQDVGRRAHRLSRQ